MNRFLEARQEPGAGLDVDCFFAVIGDWAKGWRDDLLQLGQIDTPADLVIGDADPVIGDADPLADPAVTGRLCRNIFSHVERRVFEETGHLPHLERPGEFIQLLLDTVQYPSASFKAM